jgi:hypothetical protein
MPTPRERRTTIPTLNVPDREQIWWVARYIVFCELAEPASRSEFERRASRYRDQVKRQGPDNSVLGNVQLARNVDVESAYLISGEDWETGMHWAA